MDRLRSVATSIALCCFLAVRAQADVAAGTTAYPFTANLTLAAEQREKCLVRNGENCEVELGNVLQRAYDDVFRRMFRVTAGDARPDLDITVVPAAASVADDMGGRAMLETTVTIVSATAGRIDAFDCSGQSTVLGDGPQYVVTAADEAASQLARDFERKFADSPRVFNWLHGRGIEPVDSALSWPARPDWIAFFDASGGAMIGAGDEAAPAFVARFGAAGPWFVVQGILGRWVPSFATSASGASANADLETTDFGLEAGFRLRRGDRWELRAGGGGHVLWGFAGPYGYDSVTFTRLTPTLFGAVQYTLWPTGSRIRVRTGLEVRSYLTATADLAPFRDVKAADTYVGFSIGLEFPIGAKPGRTQTSGK
jgi:hypothetical protein